MDFSPGENNKKLREAAQNLFAKALLKADPENCLRQAVQLRNRHLWLFDLALNPEDFSEIYAIAIGKAAWPLANGLDKILAGKITRGIISAPESNILLPSSWQVFAGGHPLPNKASLEAGRAAADLLQQANHKKALVIFLISGGGSAMIELLRDKHVTLEDLQETNRILVSYSGAAISEINTIRRCLSQIKGGGLSKLAPLATRVSLIVSDTNPGDEANVASGPTIIRSDIEDSHSKITEIIKRYRLDEALPERVSASLSECQPPTGSIDKINHSIFTLVDNQAAVEAIEEAAEELGFMTEIVPDLIETPIDEGCRELVSRLLALREQFGKEHKTICLISGGEFSCPVRGSGTGGRNIESALRTAILFDELNKQEKYSQTKFAALFAGTDGIDGNSPAAGAFADHTTIDRAKAIKMDAGKFLANSDAYTFFAALGDSIETGPTGTNVRDVRILLAL